MPSPSLPLQPKFLPSLILRKGQWLLVCPHLLLCLEHSPHVGPQALHTLASAPLSLWARYASLFPSYQQGTSQALFITVLGSNVTCSEALPDPQAVSFPVPRVWSLLDSLGGISVPDYFSPTQVIVTPW